MNIETITTQLYKRQLEDLQIATYLNKLAIRERENMERKERRVGKEVGCYGSTGN